MNVNHFSEKGTCGRMIGGVNAGRRYIFTGGFYYVKFYI